MWVYRRLVCTRGYEDDEYERTLLIASMPADLFMVFNNVWIAWQTEQSIIDACRKPDVFGKRVSESRIVEILLALINSGKVCRKFIQTDCDDSEAIASEANQSDLYFQFEARACNEFRSL